MRTTWRNHESHRAESNAVRRALRKAGIKAKVGHGTGTAWAWLEIAPVYNGMPNELRTELRERITKIALTVTGRPSDRQILVE